MIDPIIGGLFGALAFGLGGLGLYSVLTGKSASDLLGLIVGGSSAGAGGLLDMYTSFSAAITRGFEFDGVGYSLLAIGLVMFCGVMALNFISTRNWTLIR